MEMRKQRFGLQAPVGPRVVAAFGCALVMATLWLLAAPLIDGRRHASSSAADPRSPVPPPARSLLAARMTAARDQAGLVKQAWAQDAEPVRIYLPIVSPQPLPVGPPVLSHARGFYDAPFLLDIRSSTLGARIRFTTDGTVPTLDHGLEYQGPIPIGGTTSLRVAAFRPGMEPSPIQTHTYLFLDQVLRQPSQPDPNRFPDFWGEYVEGMLAGDRVPASYGMDPKVVDDPRSAPQMRDALLALPSLSILTTPSDMFGAPPKFGYGPGIYSHPLETGREWERPASAELILPDGSTGFQIDCGIRIAGGWSRKPDGMPKHSFSLRFRSSYGEARLRYPLFPGSPASSFDTLRLRAGQADTFLYMPGKALYVHDPWARQTALELGHPAARSRYVHLYLNGLYWGLYDLSEEPTAAFAEENLGGAEPEYDVIKGYEEVWVEHGKIRTAPSYEVEDGEAAAFEALLAITAPDQPPASAPGRLEAMAELLDLDQHAEYTLLQIYGANDDWLNKNWRALRRRNPGETWKFLIWDMERTVLLRDRYPRCGDPAGGTCDTWTVNGLPRSNVGNIADTPGVMGLHGWLKSSPDYRLRFADRARDLLFEGGVLTTESATRRFNALLNRIDLAILGESARWGSVEPGPRTRNETFTLWSLFRQTTPDHTQRRDPHWLGERERLLTGALPERNRIVVQQLCQAGLFPPVSPLRAVVEEARNGAGTRLSFEPLPGGCAGAPSGDTIYYTLDGSDPRSAGSGTPGIWWDGLPSAAARPYRGPLMLSEYAYLRARMAREQDGRLLWGAEVAQRLGQPRIAISELMYHPPAPDGEPHANLGTNPDARVEAPEFLELRNLETVSVDLSGARLGGVTLTLPAETLLEPGEHLLLVSDAEAFEATHPDLPPAQEFQGNLANGGETIWLDDRLGHRLATLSYDDEGFWPLAPDGFGYSLVPIDPWAETSVDPETWRASAYAGGSPGREDPLPPFARVLVNEVLAASDPPYEDAVELFNPGLAPVDIGGWFLSDGRANLFKYRFPPRTRIEPGSFLTVYEEALRSGGAGGDGGFAISGNGEAVILSSADGAGRLTGAIGGVSFGPSDANVSLGRHRTSDGRIALARQREPSFGVTDPADVEDFRRGRGAVNVGPRVGPLLINEIMYQPRAGGEYLELRNVSDQEIDLGEEGWALTEGLRMSFAAGTRVPAGGYAILSATEPEAFRIIHDVPLAVPVMGPFVGRLDNQGERLVLARTNAGGSGFVEIEALHFGTGSPWPALAAGRGASLERLEGGSPGYADDPASWIALSSGGTPGRANSVMRRVFMPWLSVGALARE